MALIQVDFMSKSLLRNVPINVILPADKLAVPGIPAREDKPFKTLYLLHGLFGNYTDWLSGTRIQRLAEAKNLAVVMPSGDNSFYLDQPDSGNNYGEYIGRELVEITRKMFPLSHDRKDTYIGGLSMGGYGAIRNGLKYHDNFGYIIGLSSAVRNVEGNEDARIRNIAYEQSCFGDPNEAVLTDKNPRVIVEELKRQGGAKFPKIFMACGTEDGLIDVNRSLRDYFVGSGLDVTYHEEAGKHDWDFWDKYIEKSLDWLPLEDTTTGITSGSVNG